VGTARVFQILEEQETAQKKSGADPDFPDSDAGKKLGF
jgi:hypothetical protein